MKPGAGSTQLKFNESSTASRQMFFARATGARQGCFWALQDVSFEYYPGEVDRVCRANGSAKDAP